MSTHTTTYPDSNVPPARAIQSDARGAKENNEAAAPELKDRLRHMMESSKERVTEWKGGFENGIRERPIQSVLIAAGIGAVIGLVIGRRSH